MKCKNGHKPPPGYRELEGDELERHLRQIEKEQDEKTTKDRIRDKAPFQMVRRFRKRLPEDPPPDPRHCLHFYVKK